MDPARETTVDTEPYHIPGWVIDKVIRYGEVTKGLSKAIRGRLEDELKPLPDKFIDKTYRFILSLHPMTSDSRTVLSTESHNQPSVDLSKTQETSEAIQLFIEKMYDELYAHYMAALLVPESPKVLGGSLRRRSSQNARNRNTSGLSDPSTPTLGDEHREKEDAKKKEREKREAEEQAETQATEAATAIESAICNQLYNQ
jgi:hypothetical protein